MSAYGALKAVSTRYLNSSSCTNFIGRLNEPDDGDNGYSSCFEVGLHYTCMVLKSLGNLMSFYNSPWLLFNMLIK